jgi:ribonucleoside-diphosphate reductase alpha chain
MKVIKRDSTEENVSFDKVLNRIQNLSNDLENVSVYEVAQKVCSRIYNGVHTSELDELAAQICSSMIIEHPDYGKLASRIIISNHQKNTSPSFSETIQLLWDNKDVHGAPNPLVSQDLYDTVQKYKEKLNSYIEYERDYLFDYFGFKTLEKGYLIRVHGRVTERPQHMFMRVALGIHGSDIREALQTYDLMSKNYYTLVIRAL